MFIGREGEQAEILAAVSRRAHVLVTGPLGIGKSALLAEVAAQIPNAVRVPAGTPRQVLISALEDCHRVVGLRVEESLLPPALATLARQRGHIPWRNLRRTLTRLQVPQMIELLVRSLVDRGVVLVFDSLEMPPSLANRLANLFDVVQVVAAMDENNHRVRIEKMLWRFNATITLKTLTLEQSRALAEQRLAEHPVRFASEGARDTFLRHVAQESHGVPAAILGMVETAGTHDEVTPATIHRFTHDSAIRYLDMTPFLLVAVIGFIALRYISRGIESEELYIFSGLGMALFMLVRLFLMFTRRRGSA